MRFGGEGSRRNVLSRLTPENSGEYFELGNIFLHFKNTVSQPRKHYKI